MGKHSTLLLCKVMLISVSVDQRQNNENSALLERNVDSSEIAAYGGGCKRDGINVRCNWIEG